MSNNQNYNEYYKLKNGLLIIVSGPSGAGKSELCKSYVNRFQKTLLSVSETTRPPRGRERDGREYYFIDEDTFNSRVEDGYYLESAGIYNNHYGTPKEPVMQALEEGRDVILEIEPQGAMQVVKKIPEAITVFVLPTSFRILEQQIRARDTETEEEIQLRLANTRELISKVPEYDYVVINNRGRMTNTVMELASIIQAEKCSVSRILNQYREKDE